METQLLSLIILVVCVWLIASEFTKDKKITQFVNGLFGGEDANG